MNAPTGPANDGRSWFDAADAPSRPGLETCIHCGLCLTACPTYRTLRTEPDSPRGRLYLMRGLLEGRVAASDELVTHLDRCLDCRACETACPAGVPYSQLLEASRAQIERRVRRPTPLRLFGSWVLAQVLPHRGRMHLAADLLRLSQRGPLAALARAADARGWLPRFASRGLALTPAILRRRERALELVRERLPEGARVERRAEGLVFLPADRPKARVGFHTSCVMETMFPALNHETVRLLVIAGAEVHVPEAQGCCGALHAHGGAREQARSLARANVRAFGAGCEFVVSNSAGCGAALREAGHLLGTTPAPSRSPAACATCPRCSTSSGSPPPGSRCTRRATRRARWRSATTIPATSRTHRRCASARERCCARCPASARGPAQQRLVLRQRGRLQPRAARAGRRAARAEAGRRRARGARRGDRVEPRLPHAHAPRRGRARRRRDLRAPGRGPGRRLPGRRAPRMSAPVFSRRAAAALFLARQRLDRPRARRLTAGSLADFAGATCGVQVDSVNVVERAHLLTLWSRFGEFDRAAFDRLAYGRRVLFEYLSHVACFVDARDLPLWRAMMDSRPESFRRRHGYPGRQRAFVDQVERAIAERAPLGTSGFERPKGHKSGWWAWKPAAHALDYLWKAGRTAVHSRRNFEKLYAPMSQVLPHAADVAPLTAGEVRRERVLRSLRAMGAATLDDLAMYWTWPQMMRPEWRRTVAALEREGVVTTVAIEGQSGHWYARDR